MSYTSNHKYPIKILKGKRYIISKEVDKIEEIISSIIKI